MGIAIGSEPDPRERYAELLAERRAQFALRDRRARWTSNLRLLTFAAGFVAAWFVFATRSLSAFWLLVAVAAFIALVVLHDRILRGRDRAQRSVDFYERGVARLTDRWMGGGALGEEFRDTGHLYTEDLDVFGEGSLFELLCTARTRAGEETLAGWLREPATAAEVRARQEAVEDLCPRLALREDLARLGADVRAGLHPEALRTWGEQPTTLSGRGVALASGALAGATLLGLVVWLATPIGAIAFVAPWLASSGFALAVRKRVQELVRHLELPGHDLALFSELLNRLESEPAESTRLRELRAALHTEGLPPSRGIAQLRLRIDLLDARRNQLFWPIAAMTMWTTQLAFAIDRWRARYGPALGQWIDAVGEFEALSALAGFGFERPTYPFPEVVDGPARFEGRSIGHPLIPADRCVTNDVRLDAERQVLVVSGSNMSGKSTLLRTVGVNSVLALAGAPVCAASLTLSPLAIGASIRLQDSLREGSSRFYAEILRLRDIAALAQGEQRVLFLLDEILHGTNSHDRGIGAEAVVRCLIDRHAIGLVTTHDLALARVADQLAPIAANVHFEDHIEGDEIAFDFRMREGVVTKSNALALMRAVGLDV